jgi:hypothetical protein
MALAPLDQKLREGFEQIIGRSEKAVEVGVGQNIDRGGQEIRRVTPSMQLVIGTTATT